MMQRMARKIHGRLLAVNYRLAPQYPFPCAIQDILAACTRYTFSVAENIANRLTTL